MINLIKHPFVWVFIIIILALFILIILRGVYKKNFIGYVRSRIGEKDRILPLRKKTLFKTNNEAELSLSIKGDKQDASLVCLKLKNIKDIISKGGENARETIQKIISIAEENKAANTTSSGKASSRPLATFLYCLAFPSGCSLGLSSRTKFKDFGKNKKMEEK